MPDGSGAETRETRVDADFVDLPPNPDVYRCNSCTRQGPWYDVENHETQNAGFTLFQYNNESGVYEERGRVSQVGDPVSQ